MSQLAHQSDQAAPTASASPSVAAAIASGSASTTTTNYVAISASASTNAISSEAAMEARADDLHHFHSHQDFMGQDSPTVGRITFSNSPFSPLGSLSPAPR